MTSFVVGFFFFFLKKKWKMWCKRWKEIRRAEIQHQNRIQILYILFISISPNLVDTDAISKNLRRELKANWKNQTTHVLHLISFITTAFNTSHICLLTTFKFICWNFIAKSLQSQFGVLFLVCINLSV